MKLEPQTYHISEDHRSQPIDVHVLQKSVRILLKEEDAGSYIRCSLQHERACTGVLCTCVTLLVVEAL